MLKQFRVLALMGVATAVSLAAFGGENAAFAKTAPAAANDIVHANDIVLGKANAPVTVIEYASPSCPHCAAFHETVFPTIKKDYIDTGKVRFVFREFLVHPGYDQVGTALMRCAAEKGGTKAYFTTLEGLFHGQSPTDPAQSWLTGTDRRGALVKIASAGGVAPDQFDACLQRQDLADVMEKNVHEAIEKYNVGHTPSMIVNGRNVDIYTVEAFRSTVDAELKKEKR